MTSRRHCKFAGHPHVFAVGDVTTLRPKMAGYAGRQAAIVAGNVRALIAGEQLTETEPMPEVILVTVGPEGGAAQLPGQNEIAGADVAPNTRAAT